MTALSKRTQTREERALQCHLLLIIAMEALIVVVNVVSISDVMDHRPGKCLCLVEIGVPPLMSQPSGRVTIKTFQDNPSRRNTVVRTNLMKILEGCCSA